MSKHQKALMKQLVSESIELHLRNNKCLDNDSLNLLNEYAPLIVTKLSEMHGVTRGEFRKYVANGGINIEQIRRAIARY